MAFVFGALRGAARLGLARQYALGRLGPGVSANTILTELRGLGLGIRRVNFLAIIREGQGRELSRNTLRFVPKRAVPSLRHYAQTRINQAKRFQTIFEVSGTNRLTGEFERRTVSLLHDERLTAGTLEAEIEQMIRDSQGPSGIIEPTEVLLLEGLVRAEVPFAPEA